MAIKNAFATIAVSKLSSAIPWYERLLDRAPDVRPKEQSVEWRFGGGGSVKVFQDDQRAGSCSITFVEDDLDDRLLDLKAKGIEIRTTSDSHSVKTAYIKDPDGNEIVFAESKVKRG